MGDSLAKIEERHVKERIARRTSIGSDDWCKACGLAWPCDAAVLAAAMKELESIQGRAQEAHDSCVRMLNRERPVDPELAYTLLQNRDMLARILGHSRVPAEQEREKP